MRTNCTESRRKLVELLEAKVGSDRAREFLHTPNPVLGWQKPAEVLDGDHLNMMRVTVLVTSMGTTTVAAA
ncbi:antitoxin Xre/MbcA/ParS toxin-binding domain-containing protein [Roseivivax sediminis]|uniref:Antitoxin Xre/MbcA/ParS-like toxin-binding domain-containing protein n=1 Tax=Roseivivax sediminis TaxID=936889 RepID=A0A1I1ZZQ0_9RHOB|nr:antitoxin Xre/MbcA/ParS toxin-binding domain-containing protein [Roseivivax sediminis]SFE37096.1 Protein of unknown function [Roseivivax sediminis]